MVAPSLEPQVHSSFETKEEPPAQGTVLSVMAAGNLARFRARTQRSGKGGKKAPNYPPSLSVIPVLSCTRRFFTNATVNVSITATQLIAASGVFVTTATTALTLSQSVRLRKIVVWPGLIGSGSVVAQTELYWSGEIVSGSGGQNILRQKINDRTMPDGVSDERCLTFTPPSSMQEYILPGNNGVFTIVCPLGSVIDIHGSWQQVTGISSMAPTAYTVSGGSANTIAYPFLDQSGGKISPVGLLTIV